MGFVAAASGVRAHEVVSMALEAVARVAHRGAASTDNSGDGAGLLTQIPARLFYRDAYRLGLHLQPGLPFGVGAFFLPGEPAALGAARGEGGLDRLRSGVDVRRQVDGGQFLDFDLRARDAGADLLGRLRAEGQDLFRRGPAGERARSIGQLLRQQRARRAELLDGLPLGFERAAPLAQGGDRQRTSPRDSAQLLLDLRGDPVELLVDYALSVQGLVPAPQPARAVQHERRPGHERERHPAPGDRGGAEERGGDSADAGDPGGHGEREPGARDVRQPGLRLQAVPCDPQLRLPIPDPLQPSETLEEVRRIALLDGDRDRVLDGGELPRGALEPVARFLDRGLALPLGVDPGLERVLEGLTELVGRDPEPHSDVVGQRGLVGGGDAGGSEAERGDRGCGEDGGGEASHVNHSFRRGTQIEAPARSEAVNGA